MALAAAVSSLGAVIRGLFKLRIWAVTGSPSAAFVPDRPFSMKTLNHLDSQRLSASFTCLPSEAS